MIPKIKIILSLPRSGTHFIWSRLVGSGSYQLIYDADRLAAFEVLGRDCSERLDFLYPCPRNPNYNFQYNSLVDVDRPLTASEHLAGLCERYRASSAREAFQNAMSRQDGRGRTLFSVNRFAYTSRYEFLFREFRWTMTHAVESLKLLRGWFHELGANAEFAFVARPMREWAQSLAYRTRSAELEFIEKALSDVPAVLRACSELEIPVFMMRDVISSIKGGMLDFEKSLAPLNGQAICDLGDEAVRAASDLRQNVRTATGPGAFQLRLGRLLRYLRENDPIERTSMVRSIGSLPVRVSGFLPVLGRRIRKDCEGLALNNAKITPDEAHVGNEVHR